MAQDAAGFIAILKEVWISEVIEDLIYQGNPLLDALERVKPTSEEGRVAVIPIHTGGSGAYTAVPRSGSEKLNPAGRQKYSKAEYDYTHHWFPISLETAVIDESSGKPLAVAQAVETEMTGAVNDIRRQLTRQAFMDGSALIAQCAKQEAEESKVIKLLPGGYGFDAIQRGWLYPEIPVDIGTKENEVSVAEASEITAVDEDEAEPTITISKAVKTKETDYVSIAQSRDGEESNEMDGLLKLVSESAVVGNIDPKVVPRWRSRIDSTEQALGLPAVYDRMRVIFQATGEEPDWALTSAKQYQKFYEELEASVRFNGDGNLQAGNMAGLKVGKMLLERQPDCPNRAFYLLTKKDLVSVRKEGPQWASQKYGGSSSPVQYVEGTTKVKGSLFYRMQMGVKRRESHSALTALK